MKIVSNLQPWNREAGRLGRLPDAKTVAMLNAVLKDGLLEAVGLTHVDTGSLKSSAKSKSSKTLSQWEGEFSFGGPSAGINNPVDYAIYEKARGGEHDFFKAVHTLAPKFREAIKKGLTP